MNNGSTTTCNNCKYFLPAAKKCNECNGELVDIEDTTYGCNRFKSAYTFQTTDYIYNTFEFPSRDGVKDNTNYTDVVVGTPPDNWYDGFDLTKITTTTFDSNKYLYVAPNTHNVRIYRINKNNPLPSQANSGDAGMDVYCSETTIFKPGEKKAVPLGIIVEAPMGYHFKLCIRSSVAFKRGFKLVNSVGIIDSGFSGPEDEVKILLEAPSNIFEEVILEEGERLGQLLLEKNETIVWEEQEDRDFNKTSRGGIGSSGV